MTDSAPTRAQMERDLGQRIQALYREQLGHRPRKVTCQFFDQKLAIVLEDATIAPEQLLLENQRQKFAEALRMELAEAIKPQLKALIEEVTGVQIVTLLNDSDLENGTSGIVAILADIPVVRDPESIPKASLRRAADASSG